MIVDLLLPTAPVQAAVFVTEAVNLTGVAPTLVPVGDTGLRVSQPGRPPAVVNEVPPEAADVTDTDCDGPVE